MKIQHSSAALQFLFTLLVIHPLAAMEAPVIVPAEDPADPAPMRVVWATEPGVRYQLQESSTLEEGDWTTVAGFPTEAEALAQQHAFSTDGDRRFFRVAELDEQGPELVSLSPDDGAFGVGRFSAMTVTLTDRSGIDHSVFELSVGDRPNIGPSNPFTSFEDGVLTFDMGGEYALGAYGEVVDCSLTVVDVHGNVATYYWSFELEIEIVVVDDLFVFGSPDALRAGQQLGAVSAAVAARFGGPVRMGDPPAEWSLESVDAGLVVVSYTSENAPDLFHVNQKITNLAPAHESEIFYRVVTEVMVDAGAKRVILQTTDLELPDIITDGSFTFGEDAVELEFDEEGNLLAMRTLTIKLKPLGAQLSNETVIYRSDANDVRFILEEARALFHPSVTFSVKTKRFSLEKFLAKAEGRVDVAMIPRLEIDGSYSANHSKEVWNKSFWVWTAVGIVPVGVQVKTSITAKASVNVAAQATFRTGFRQTASMGLQGVYARNASPSVSWNRWFTVDPMERIPFTYTLDGEGWASVSVIPQIDIRLYGVGGAYLNVDPRVNLSGSASITNGVLNHGHWLLGVYADLNAGLSVIGFKNSQLPAMGSTRLFSMEWGQSYTVAPSTPLAITRHPQSQSARIGDSVIFSAAAVGGDDLRFRWYQNDVLLPHIRGSAFRLRTISAGAAGEYRVRVTDSTGSVDSEIATLSIVNEGITGPVLAGFSRIPGGWFTMGDTLDGDPWGDAPLVNVDVSEFYMATHEVTWELWNDVRNWAINHGYTDIATGGGKGGDHPVHTVNWWDVVKWCNARSEMDGLTPVYTVGGNVMRSGTTHPVANWNANGYRLPSEAEWEKAARGGVFGLRFPWGDEITHGEANYYSWDYYAYDTSATRGYHPAYQDGTAPVGSFAANGYGLHDVAGNVYEWCWDWHDSSTYVAGAINPTGPTEGAYKLIRGGSYNDFADDCRVCLRNGTHWPGSRYFGMGFRPARSSVP